MLPVNNPVPGGETPSASAPPRRLASLDAFRGATVALMLVVNNIALGNDTPAQLKHAEWGQIVSVADLVFPWFLLCAGLSLPFSFRSAIRKGLTTRQWAGKSIARAISLFVVGLFLDCAIARHLQFGLGVLQLIALSSLVAALIMPLSAKVRAITASVLILGYGAALVWIPIPGVEHPVLSESLNLVGYLNDTFLRPIGLRGLPSVIPTAALVIMGTLIGEFLASEKRRMAWLCGAGIGLTLLGLIWASGHPMAKSLWTAPYILFSCGLGTLAICLLSVLLDGRSWAKLAAPLTVFGANPLVAYTGPILVKVLILQVWTLADGTTLQEAWLQGLVQRWGAIGGGWVYTLEYVAITWVALAWMRWRGVSFRL